VLDALFLSSVSCSKNRKVPRHPCSLKKLAVVVDIMDLQPLRRHVAKGLAD